MRARRTFIILPALLAAASARADALDLPLPRYPRVVVTDEAYRLFEQDRLLSPDDPLLQELSPTSPASTVKQRLYQVSMARPFRVVGKLIRDSGNECTATWLGEREGFTYLLTAAHCVARQTSATETPYSGRFVAWNSKTVAEGAGVGHVPPSAAGAATTDLAARAAYDIAVVKLPTKKPAVDVQGQPLEPPLLNDLPVTASRVDLVGYGGTEFLTPGSRRQWGRSELGETDNGVLVSVTRPDRTSSWAVIAQGDSGSGWWQERHGSWAVVGVSSGGTYLPPNESENRARATSVEPWVTWLKSVFPEVRTLKERFTVKSEEPFVSPGQEGSLPGAPPLGAQFFSVPEAIGSRVAPAMPTWAAETADLAVFTVVTREGTGQQAEVGLRVKWGQTCSISESPVGAYCRSRFSPLTVAFHQTDNPLIEPGRWTGQLQVEERTTNAGGISVDFMPIYLDLLVSPLSSRRQRLNTDQPPRLQGSTVTLPQGAVDKRKDELRRDVSANATMPGSSATRLGWIVESLATMLGLSGRLRSGGGE